MDTAASRETKRTDKLTSYENSPERFPVHSWTSSRLATSESPRMYRNSTRYETCRKMISAEDDSICRLRQLIEGTEAADAGFRAIFEIEEVFERNLFRVRGG